MKLWVLFWAVKVWGSIWIFLRVCDPIDGCDKWMFLVIWDATSFSALLMAFRVYEKPDTIPNVEIIAPKMFMALIWWKYVMSRNIQNEYQVSAQTNIT
jgi:hypothetical protein